MKRHQLEAHPTNTEPLYDEITESAHNTDIANCSCDSEIKMERNNCYGNSRDHMIMTVCSAYEVN